MVQKTFSLNRVLIPLVDHMLSTSISLPLEMIQAGVTYSRLRHQHPGVEVCFCAEQLNPIISMSGIPLTPEVTFSETGPGDLVIVPGLWRNPLPVVRQSRAMVKWLRYQHQQGATFCVAATGVTFMAETGLLNHQPAATHWYFLERLKRHYPKVDFKPHHLITRSGRIFCAGSVNSVADLMVHLIELSMGEQIAHKVEQQFSHEIRRPMDQILFAEDHTTAHNDEVIIQLQEWIRQHYCEDIEMENLIAASGLTRRTLHRRFKEATGFSPTAYIQRMRLTLASDLLKSTDLSIREAAYQAGYTDPDYFSRLFQKHFQLTPSDFKRSVRGKLFYLESS
ncbi:GlxA family transcriptional regulator [Endozoicomonas sp. 8E]|uniref:GlxA family transcriptional regulator n=1 Tax=Endozoicomonas sp. 8E TaxID=3035692 RepID=UPI0029393ADA|nr:helix-turn-helix domain-containing protein [Endozoicomonas sp. 8E]WOG30213.1 helix-turn-helix domain-containing protein [Endozoicomonas sp. 8E]